MDSTRHSATITRAGLHDPVAEPVAALDDLEHRAGLGAVARLREQGLVDVRIEGSVGVDLGSPPSRARCAATSRRA